MLTRDGDLDEDEDAVYTGQFVEELKLAEYDEEKKIDERWRVNNVANAKKAVSKKTRGVGTLTSINLNEWMTLQKVKHRHVINGSQCLYNPIKAILICVTEFAENGDISRLIKLQDEERQSFLEEELHLMFVMLISALDHAHRKGIVHKDISPQNMYIDGAGDLKLANFGVVRDTRVIERDKETGKETHKGGVGTL